MSKTTMTVTSNSNYIDDKSVFIDIYEKLKNIPIDEANSDRVCVCHAPKSLVSFKADPFIPQCVGLGPYHHFNVDLMMTEEFKLGAAKRVLQLRDNMDLFHQCLQNNGLDIQPFYHVDVHSRYPCHELLYVLGVDGLFLLAVLHTGVKDKGPKSQQTYFLTGKPGMSLVNAAGVELTMDGIFVDLFIIDNQIPTQVLKHINKVNMVDNIDLGSAMRTFCEAFCPLVHYNNLPKSPEDHDHLLDLMYHLTADSEPEPTSEPKPLSLLEKLTGIFVVVPFLIVLSITFCAILIPLLLMQISLWLIMVLFHKVFPSVPSPSLSKESFATIISSALVLSLIYLVILEDTLLKKYTSGFFRDQEKGMFERIKHSISCDVMIPTATELYLNQINMKPAKGGIASIKYHFRQFQLPVIKLDVNTEIIIRNLMAYESLTKSNGLIFTEYVALMCALIHTAEDANLLIRNGIIKTRLSKEVVAQLFNGLRNSLNTESLDIQKLEQELFKVEIAFYRLRHSERLIYVVAVFFLTWAVIQIIILPILTLGYCFFNPDSKYCTSPVLDANHHCLCSM